MCTQPSLEHLLGLLIAALLLKVVNTSCECGYSINTSTTNTTHPSSPVVFNTILTTDFLHLKSITNNPDWIPQAYTVSPALARGPYGKNASVGNVITNPLASKWDWAGPGAGGGDAGLKLLVRSGAGVVGGLIGMAELASARTDVLYGSFRAGMKVTPTNGTCGAVFFYRNDTQEIDMEFLSSQQNAASHTANLVLQSPASQEAGNNAAGTGSFLPYPLPFDPTAAFHEYRYDWTPSSVTFYADSTPLTTMNTTSAIPDSPGHLSFSHWSNGDPAWSGGPPAQDAILTVSYFKAFFNASSAPAAPANGCGYGNPAARGVCAVPDLTGAPDGNASAWAAWYGSPGGTEPGGEVGKKGAAQRLGVGMSGMLMLVSVVVCLRVVGP